MSITILGLGPGNPDHLTLEAWRTLQVAQTVILRTARHPTVPALPQGPSYRSLDDRYEQAADFAALYRDIAAEIV
ncbi:MAG: tetrapyrrole methylase, partial [Anaerolineae bacterium]|nr:tetrapyrrole methylase [Anaerolineae bacterium]